VSYVKELVSDEEKFLRNGKLILMPRKFSTSNLAARLCVLSLALTGLANAWPALGEREEGRLAAVRNATDQDELVDIAFNDDSPLVRAAAVKKLTDRFQIARIAVEDDAKDGSVRAVAIAKLSDLDLLTRIAVGEETYRKGLSPEVYLHLRTVAVERIEDQAVLTQVALEDIPVDTTPVDATPVGETKEGSLRTNARILRMTAIDKITDQTLLAKVALEAKAGDACKAAVQKMTDPALLLTVMQEDKDTDLHGAAKAKLARDLLRAVTAGDIATVRLLATSFALDLRDANGRTLLMLASETGQVQVVKFLLDSGVDVNEENVIQDYVRMPNGAAVYPGPTLTVAGISSSLPGSVIVPGRRETALSLTSPISHPETRELLITAGAK
jgi:hypothetical protein